MNTKNMKFFIYFPLLLGLIFSILSFRFTSPDEFTGAPLWSPVYFFSYSFFSSLLLFLMLRYNALHRHYSDIFFTRQYFSSKSTVPFFTLSTIC